MNKIETLFKTIKVDGNIYQPYVYLTAWGRWCVSYKNITDIFDYLCSVTVEPENEPHFINSSNSSINARIGNTRTLDDAIDMITNYLKSKGYIDD